MIRFITKKHPEKPGFVIHTIEMPDTNYPEAVYEGPLAADRLMRFCRTLAAGATDDQIGVVTPKGWRRVGISADGIHSFHHGMLLANVSIHGGLLILSVSCNNTMANDQQCAYAAKAFVPDGVTMKEKNITKSHVRYFWGALPGYRLEWPEGMSQPMAVKEI